MKIAIVGFGYWGPNLVRNFNNTAHAEVACIVDANVQRLQKVKQLYPSMEVTTDFQDVLTDDMIEAIAIATPVFTHFPLAKAALSHGKHVLLEKPMTSSVEEAQTLIDLAAEKNCVLMVDHTYLYTNAVQKIKQLIDTNVIGDLKYIDSTRINLGLFKEM